MQTFKTHTWRNDSPKPVTLRFFLEPGRYDRFSCEAGGRVEIPDIYSDAQIYQHAPQLIRDDSEPTE